MNLRPVGITVVTIFGLFAVGGCAPRKFNADGEIMKTVDLAPELRANYMAQAEAWTAGSDVEVPMRDLRAGPSNKLFTRPEIELACDFVDVDPQDTPGGRTPKFMCAFNENGETKIYKVKYDPYYNLINGTGGNRNQEVYGEVLATRLMWALGFPADKIYTARIMCRNCPPDPWLYMRKKTGILDGKDNAIGFVRTELLKTGEWERKANRVFHPAVVEVKFKGTQMVSGATAGWEWNELFTKMANPAAQKPQREALTILMAFINHMDNKDVQQRLVCDKDAMNGNVCTKPIAMVQDAGSNFGNGWAPFQGDIRLNKLDLAKWSALNLWSDLNRCIVKLHGSPNASFRDTWQVSEQGRQFLANLMSRLNRNQIRELFYASRLSMSGTSDSIERWVTLFVDKMNRDILNVRCGI
jgi:hypothetical protein